MVIKKHSNPLYNRSSASKPQTRMLKVSAPARLVLETCLHLVSWLQMMSFLVQWVSSSSLLSVVDTLSFMNGTNFSKMLLLGDS